MGDYRRTQQHGWITRTFRVDGSEVRTPVTIPVAENAEDRVVGVDWPTRGLADDRDIKYLSALLGYMSGRGGQSGDAAVRWEFMPEPPKNTPVCGLVYRILVGRVAAQDWVDVPLRVLAGRIAYWRERDRVVLTLPHPETMRRGAGKKVSEYTQAVRDFGAVVRGDVSALDHMGLDCVACAASDHPETATRWHVTEMDRNGFGLCRVHSGWDLRPEGQKWAQEKML